MKQAKVYYNAIEAGMLTQEKNDWFVFEYHHLYFNNPTYPAISKTFPKTTKIFESKVLFPFFVNLLAQGVNKDLQCVALHIDTTDYFELLLQTAHTETIGAITIKKLISTT